ncbi:4-phosphoerythronate dehydrogenase [Longibacter sp.]|uniref:4-phosphoerythronate dehydrogenase n=1 Tax=Longibacter sp. TaxID=2045415 RepID=UPI003EBD1091
MSTPSLSLLADENIPLAREAFQTFGSVTTRPGRDISREHLQEVDVLLVRSVTQVDANLLAGTPVRFVGSATIGTDHVDRAWLVDRNITFAHAPASNADSVADYVVTIALHLASRRQANLEARTVGVIGCGNTGSRVARRLRELGTSVLMNDPPLAEDAEENGTDHAYVSLDHIVDAADVLSLHTPLTVDGRHPTHHLIDGNVMDRLRPNTWLINTSRGAVVDNAALLHRLKKGDSPIGAVALDVWENEPTPDTSLLRRVDVATPHVAGYAYDGKVRGTAMLYRALCQFLGVAPAWSPEATVAPTHPADLRLSPPDARLPRTEYLVHLAEAACDVRGDHRRLRGILDVPDAEQGAFFSHLRKTYPRRREMQVQSVARSAVPGALHDAVRDGLRINLADA